MSDPYNFEIGDTVVLADKYWVYEPGDCDAAMSVQHIKPGDTGKVVDRHAETSGKFKLLTVAWDQDNDKDAFDRSFRVNQDAVTVPITDEEVAEAIASILGGTA